MIVFVEILQGFSSKSFPKGLRRLRFVVRELASQILGSAGGHIFVFLLGIMMYFDGVANFS